MGCSASKDDTEPEIIYYNLVNVRNIIKTHKCLGNSSPGVPWFQTGRCQCIDHIRPYINYEYKHYEGNIYNADQDENGQITRLHEFDYNKVRRLSEIVLSEQSLAYHIYTLTFGTRGTDYHKEHCCIGLRKDQWEHFGLYAEHSLPSTK